MSPTLELDRLRVLAQGQTLVEVDQLQLHAGSPVTLMGETGAGKSLLLQAIMATLPEGLSAEGRIRLAGRDTNDTDRQRLWGQELALLPQEPMLALDPIMRATHQVSEVHRWIRGAATAESESAAAAALKQVGLTNAGRHLPGALSGGMAQRLAYAAATAGGANILLADEPTKGLDECSRDAIVELLAEHAQDHTLLTVTHDLAIPRRLGGVLAIIRGGRIVEQGPVETLMAAAEHPYTRELLASDEPLAVPCFDATRATEPVIAATGLTAGYGNGALFENVDLTIRPGEVVGLAGASGIGKSSLGDALLGLLPRKTGQVSRMPKYSALRFQKLYQDPPAAFAAKVPLKQLLRELMALHQLKSAELEELLGAVAIDASMLERPADAVSGGELQRIALARVLMLRPVFLVADEPVSRLDPVTARRVLSLLVRQARERDCGVLLISHDQAQLRRLCDRAFCLQVSDYSVGEAARLVALRG